MSALGAIFENWAVDVFGKDVRLVLVAKINTFAGRVPYGVRKKDGVGKWFAMEVWGEAGPFCRWTRPGTDSAVEALLRGAWEINTQVPRPANENARQSVLGGGRVLGKGHPRRQPAAFSDGGAFLLRESQHKPHHNISQRGNFWGFAPRTRSQSRDVYAISPCSRDPGIATRQNALHDGAPQPQRGTQWCIAT